MSSSQPEEKKSQQYELLCEEFNKAERWPEWLDNYVIISQGLSDILRKIDEQRGRRTSAPAATGGGEDAEKDDNGGGGRALIEKALADLHEKFEPMETARNAKIEELQKAMRAAFEIECDERRAAQRAFMKELEKESREKRKAAAAAAAPKNNKKMKA
jgi:hypothetical protein